MQRAATLLIGLSVFSSANASEWEAVNYYNAKADDGTEVTVFASIDKQSIARTRSGLVKGWVKMEHFEDADLTDRYSGKKYRTAKQLLVANCAERTTSTMQLLYYDVSGSVVSSQVIPEKNLQFDDVVPDTLGATWLQFICSRAPKASAKPAPTPKPKAAEPTKSREL